MSKSRIPFRILYVILFVFSSCSYVLIFRNIWLALPAVLSFLLVNILPGFTDRRVPGKRLRLCSHGAECLFVFLISAVISVIYHICAAIWIFDGIKPVLLSSLICFCAHFVLFWNGIISVYCTSVQLGIKQRVIGALCGLIPVVHLFALWNIIKITLSEVKFETEKDLTNRQRQSLCICKTRYPVLFVHGVFFRDSKIINYWGRIPKQLELNGARVYYGNHQSALSVKDSALELAERIKQIVAQSGCEKVNIIAHSKGGLDCRYLLAKTDAAQYVASLTTINTPHRGCAFADYLLEKIPPALQNSIALTYNAAALKLGDKEPDFMAAVRDLTERACTEFDSLEAPKGVYCQSVGSVMKRAANGKFPLNFSYHLAKYFSGENDGLVSENSFAFGENYILVRPKGKRGISHGDMVDLNRENIPGFDVREFYVELVSGLCKLGL